jgi:hypothetical protein
MRLDSSLLNPFVFAKQIAAPCLYISIELSLRGIYRTYSTRQKNCAAKKIAPLFLPAIPAGATRIFDN